VIAKRKAERDNLDAFFYARAHKQAGKPTPLDDDHLPPVDKEIGLEWYEIWKGSGQLPFSGAWADQPHYVRKNIIYYQRLEAWHEDNAKRPDASSLPRMEDQ
jgi:hypothetical protein